MIINNKSIKIRRFSSGEMRLMQNDLLPLAKQNEVTILYKQQESLFELFLICKFFQDNNIKVNLILAYLPYQRMDHINNFEAPTLRYVIDLFNSLNINKLYICEPHSDTSQFKNVKNISLVEKILDRVYKQESFDIEKDYFVFTDKGSVYRYSHLAKNYVYFKKTRNTAGYIETHEMVGQIPKNSKVIIIDDIISSGDTINSCLNLITQQVIIVSGHYEKNKYNKQLLNNDKVYKIFSSDSLSKKQSKKLVLYKVEDLIKGENL